MVQAYNGRAQTATSQCKWTRPLCFWHCRPHPFFYSPPQIIKDRVFSHISRNKYMWNSLPGGLLVLPEYSTHLAHFPFYYLGLGNHAPHSNESAQHANPDWTGWWWDYFFFRAAEVEMSNQHSTSKSLSNIQRGPCLYFAITLKYM